MTLAKKNKPNIGVALSGGSALTIAHIGVLRALLENDISIDCIAGTSAGALVAACYAFGVPFEKVIGKARELSWFSMSKLSFSALGFISHEALRAMIREFLGDVLIEDARIPLAIIATDIETGERVVFRRGSLIDALMASTCIPGVFIPVEVGGHLLVDGGLVDNLPLSALAEMGASAKIGVNVNRWISKGRPKNYLDLVVKSLEIATADRHPPQEDEVLIEPHLEAFAPSDFKKADQLMDEGYRCAVEKMGEIRKLAKRDVAKTDLWGRMRFWFRG